MNNTALIQRRRLLEAALCAGTLSAFGAPLSAAAQTAAVDVRNWTSKEVADGFTRFALERRMPADLKKWLADPSIQVIEPYRVFDNVWNVGICWVSAYAIKTTDGWALIDTVHEPFVDALLANLKKVGVPLNDIKLVLMTHGHFDHVGGYARLRKLLPNARFCMQAKGWEEAHADSARSHRFEMPVGEETVVKDGDVITLGDNAFEVLSTPGHTWGTTSYAYWVNRGAKRYRAVTIGGQGLNAISGPEQIDAFIASMTRLGQTTPAIEVDMTAHPFSTGLTEQIPAICALKAGDAHPLVDRAGYLARLDKLIAGAKRYRKEKYPNL